MMLLTEESMSWHTSFHIGGAADYYAKVSDVDDLAQAMFFAGTRGIPVFVLGNGSNILVSDKGIRGMVIENRLQNVCISPDGRIRAESGVPLAGLARFASRHGLAGLEWAAGIPGTLGGAIVANAGAFGSCIGDVLIWTGVLSEGCTELVLCKEELSFGYRTSIFKDSGTKNEPTIILEAELALQPAPQAEVEARLKEFAARRRQTQPAGTNAGSIFKNPPGDYAGRLIEAAGLKGYRIGDAQISPKHANFIANRGNARASDVAGLIDLARVQVKDRFGIWLDLEIELVGEWH